MQTIYHTTAQFICHTGNIVDFGEYRRRLELVAETGTKHSPPEATEERVTGRTRHRFAGVYPGLFLDFCASAAIVVMTVTVIVQFIVL